VSTENLSHILFDSSSSLLFLYTNLWLHKCLWDDFISKLGDYLSASSSISWSYVVLESLIDGLDNDENVDIYEENDESTNERCDLKMNQISAQFITGINGGNEAEDEVGENLFVVALEEMDGKV
jgi:hypothetical protein